MPDNINFDEILVAPLEAIVKKIAVSVAEAQRSIDKAAFETQTKLTEVYPELAEIGYIPTWYHMPEINVELKMVMHYERTEETGGSRVLWSPFNAKYKSAFAYEAEGTSNLKLKIVSTPPPLDLTATQPSE